MSDIYDAIIIGGGPAGLTAGMYLARAGKRVLCLEQGRLGGQIAQTSHVENYPGFPDGVTGPELVDTFEQQARRFGLEIMPGRVDGAKLGGEVKEVTVSGFPFKASVIVLATGLVQKLGIPGEEDFLGRGLSYCATCDGALMRGRPVAVVGHSDWAVEEALFLTKFVSKLYMVMRSAELKSGDEHREELLAQDCLEVVGSSVPVAITGDNQGVTGLEIEQGGEKKKLDVEAVFVCAGRKKPGTEFMDGLIEIDEKGYAVVDDNCETSVPGVYAIGDVRRRKFHQVATAVGDGAIVGMDAIRHMKKKG